MSPPRKSRRAAESRSAAARRGAAAEPPPLAATDPRAEKAACEARFLGLLAVLSLKNLHF